MSIVSASIVAFVAASANVGAVTFAHELVPVVLCCTVTTCCVDTPMPMSPESKTIILPMPLTPDTSTAAVVVVPLVADVETASVV